MTKLYEDPKEFWIDPHEHSGALGRGSTNRYTAWSRLPITGHRYIHVVPKAALRAAAKDANDLSVENSELRIRLHKLMTALAWSQKHLENFAPYDGDLPENLDPSMYHTLSYEGDCQIMNKHTENKELLKEYGFTK